MRSDRRRRNYGAFPRSQRREARLLHVRIPVFNGHRMGDEEDGGWTEDRYQMGRYTTTGGQ